MTLILLLALLAQFAPASRGAAAIAASVPVVDSVEVTASGAEPAGSGHSSFEVRFGDGVSEYPVMAMFVLPGQRVPIAVGGGTSIAAASAAEAGYTLQAAGGTVEPAGANQWAWMAPIRTGLYPIEVRDGASGETITLNVFVMAPYTAMRHGSINGYPIGAYPRPRRGHEAEYQRPAGFVEVTSALLETPVSPHFRLGQFLCKQTTAPNGPQYLVLRQPLLVKLERLLAAVNERGITAHTFSIMSAYRTPRYNKAIGNTTTFSRHEYGDAADVFVDEDHDGIMDDLNHDGRHTAADARVLGTIVNELEGDPSELADLVGGLGTYAPTSAHGPFMHVDVRGFAVEWKS